jgi:hypothetical protein
MKKKKTQDIELLFSCSSLIPPPSSLFLASSIRQHRFDALLIAFGDQRVDVELTLPLISLLGQDMSSMRVPALDLPRRRQAESLGRALMCFEFRHHYPLMI